MRRSLIRLLATALRLPLLAGSASRGIPPGTASS